MSENDFNPAFLAAGVPARYLSLNLTNLSGERPSVKPLAQYVKGVGFQADLREGKGVFLTGDDDLSETALYCVAKSAMVRQTQSIVLSVERLLYLLTTEDEDDGEAVDTLRSASALFIPQFNDPFHESNPLDPRDRYRIESFLISRIDNNKSVSVHHMDGAKKDWWSPRLLTRLRNGSTRFTL